MLGVLPLVDLSGNSNQEYLSDGLTEEIISQLGSLNPSRLGVIARTSAMTYKHTNKGVGQIGRELGVEYVVEGSVRRFGNRVRVTAQLIRASDQTHLWAENYDRDLGDILKIEEDISRSIAKAIRIQLRPPEPQDGTARPVNAEAYEDYLKGRYYWNRRYYDDVRRSIRYYSEAVAKDPNYAQAYAGLAGAYSLFGLYSVDTMDVMSKAESAAAKAVELDSSLAEAHTAMASVKALYDWDWAAAEHEFKLALDLSPDNARTHHAYAAYYCVPLGRKQETIEQMEIALKLDPLSPVISADVGWAYFLSGQTDRAIKQYQEALELDLRGVMALDRLAQAFEQKGMYKEMMMENDVNPEFPTETAVAMHRGYEQGGYQGALRAEMETWQERARQPGVVYDPYSFAFMYAKLGEYDRALENLSRAYQERNPNMVYMSVDLPFKDLRGDARFQSLELRVGLIPCRRAIVREPEPSGF
jgi:TolB-like protein/Tfp pilus assembly protein PilF